ncbi:ead/Ea22-like family protein, partial [Klebsiella grimontii]|uniref:ead/Ea22-like family protein n=1 Tax=Klebsiella grimontii TaxID=2058152 RepID=UPI002114FB4C
LGSGEQPAVMAWNYQQARIDVLVEALEKAQTINAAAEKLVRCKGRYHSEQNYRALAALFGVNTPDLPPLEHENVHYADAADMEIAALRQRIAELESRTVKLPDDAEHDIMAPVAAYLSEKFKWDGRAVRWDGRNEYDALADRVKYALRMVIRRAAGIKVEAE